MLRRHVPLALAAYSVARCQEQVPQPWGDSTYLGRPFSKDPSVVKYRGRYLLYYSMAGVPVPAGKTGFAIGIAESSNLLNWKKIGEILPEQDCESRGLCAPCAVLIKDELHLFYQSYGGGRQDAICHAVSKDGIRFRRDPSNPVFRPAGEWNAGRAIDAEVIFFKGRWLLYAATRDPQMKVQMLVGAWAPGDADFGRPSWKMLSDEPLLKPQLSWEQDCIEAPSILRRGNTLYMFYAGGYNNAPQQIGSAKSADGVRWERLSSAPLLPAGPPGSWNESESGHPAVFEDNGQTYLFYQGNPDRGRTWLLSHVRLGWREGRPHVLSD